MFFRSAAQAALPFRLMAPRANPPVADRVNAFIVLCIHWTDGRDTKCIRAVNCFCVICDRCAGQAAKLISPTGD